MRLDELKQNPAVSFWLKEALTKLENRDILDAVADAKILFDAMSERYTEVTGRVYGAKKSKGVPMSNMNDLDKVMGW